MLLKYNIHGIVMTHFKDMVVYKLDLNIGP